MDAGARKQISVFVEMAKNLEKKCEGNKPPREDKDDNATLFKILDGVKPFDKEQRPPNPPLNIMTTEELLEWVLGGIQQL